MSESIQKLLLGDCLEKLKETKDKSVQLIATDLPFGLTRNKWDSEIDLTKLWPEYWRVLKDNGVIALNSCQPFTSKLVCSQIEFWKHEWVWIKNRGSNFANTVREPFKEHETIQIFSKGKGIYNRQMQERTGAGADRVKYSFNTRTETTNYGEIGQPNEKQGELRVPSSWQKFNTEVGLHPCQKPLVLCEYIIKTYTNEGDLVLDSCAGSGTTLLAAKNLGRQFVGIEKEEKYFNIAKTRLGIE